MKKVLFLYKNRASWALQDLEIISEFCEVNEVFATKNRVLNLFGVIRDVYSCEVLFCWFGSFFFFPYILIGKLFKKKIYIVAGGFDVAYDRELNHGAFATNSISKFLRRFLFRLTDKVLAVSKSIKNETIKNAHVNEKRVEVCYLGFKPAANKLKPWSERSDDIVMISNVSEDKIKVKGIDQLFKIATELPQYNFNLIGSIADDSKKFMGLKPDNVIVKGALEFDGVEFNEVIGNSKIAIQLSHYEGFGASIIEEAIRGCYPIVYTQFGLKEVIVDGKGLKVKYGDIEALKNEISTIFEKSDFNSELSGFYLEKYCMNKRVEKLKSIILEG